MFYSRNKIRSYVLLQGGTYILFILFHFKMVPPTFSCWFSIYCSEQSGCSSILFTVFMLSYANWLVTTSCLMDRGGGSGEEVEGQGRGGRGSRKRNDPSQQHPSSLPSSLLAPPSAASLHSSSPVYHYDKSCLLCWLNIENDCVNLCKCSEQNFSIFFKHTEK